METAEEQLAQRLVRILLEDDDVDLLCCQKLNRPGAISDSDTDQQFLSLPLPSATLAPMSHKASEVLFLSEHCSLLETAFCSMSIKCLRQLIGSEESSKKLAAALSEANSPRLLPIHCLLAKLQLAEVNGNVRAEASGAETAAVAFLQSMEQEFPVLVRWCLGVVDESTSLNALETAVAAQKYRIADWMLMRASAYQTETRTLAGAQLQRVAIEDYSLTCGGQRSARHPLNILTIDSLGCLTDSGRAFWDTQLVSIWSERLLQKRKRTFFVKACIATAIKVLLLVLVYSHFYTHLTAKVYNNRTVSCGAYSMQTQLRSFLISPLGRAVSWLVQALYCIECSSVAVCFHAYLHSTKTPGQCYLVALVKHLRHRGIIILPHCTLALMLIQIPLSECLNQRLTEAEDPSKFFADWQAEIRLLDIVTCMLYGLCGFALVFDWLMLTDSVMLIWCSLGSILSFIVTVAGVVMACSWLVVLIVPCDAIFPDGLGVTGLALGFYRAMCAVSFSDESMNRLGLVFIIVHIILVLVAFNFLVAILSESVSAARADLRYLSLSNRLYALFVLEIGYAALWKRLPRCKKQDVELTDAGGYETSEEQLWIVKTDEI